MRKLATVTVFLSMVIILGCSKKISREKPSIIVAAVSADVGKVATTQDTGSGAPIVVFEENHTSIKGQLQQALMLTRLHDQYNLKNIVLEGYTEGDLDNAVDKIRKMMAKRSVADQEEVVASMLSEGEINAAEFTKLVYPEVNIEKGENPRSIASRNEEKEFNYFFKCKLAMALIAVDEGALPETEEGAFLNTLKYNLPVKKVEQLERIINACNAVISKSPWAKSHDDLLFPKNPATASSIEKEIQALNDVEERVKQLPEQFSSLTGSLTEFRTFLNARSAATDDMVKAAMRLSAGDNTTVVAMIIGAGHTEKVTALLKQMNAPFAVVRAASLDASDDVTLPLNAYQRKMQRQSVSPTLGPALNQAFSETPTRTRHKSAPVLAEEWFQAKAELYSMADELGQKLQSAGGSGSGMKPPTINTIVGGLPDDRLRGDHFSVDRSRMTISEEAGRTVLTFPVVLNPKDAARSKTIWVKIAKAEGKEKGMPGSTSKAEAALREALQDTKTAEGGKNSNIDVGSKKAGAGTGKQRGRLSRNVVRKNSLEVDQIRVSSRVHMMISNSEGIIKKARFTF